MDKHCQNDRCKNEAVSEVPVSIHKPSDGKRALCRTCEKAYCWGVQHGRMTPKNRRLWVLAVADKGIVVHGGVFASRRQAVRGLAEYLRANEGYDGPCNLPNISDWLAEHDERMGVDIFPAPLEID
jgi:hypothetical protein